MQTNIKPAASSGLNPHKYNPLSVFSIDYGEIVCNRFIECEKSDEWNHISGKGFARLAALDFPAYGRCFIKSAAFFVPYYQVVQSTDGVRQGLTSDRGKACVTPHIYSHFVSDLLARTAYSTLVTTETNPANFPNESTYDFAYSYEDVNNPGYAVWSFHILNSHGKRIYKLLKSMGLDFQSVPSSNTWSSHLSVRITCNILNLLCYCKIYTDYFLNMHLYNSSELVALLRAIADGDSYSTSGGTLYYDSSTGQLTSDAFAFIVDQIRVPFSSTLYTDAWNTVNSPIGLINTDSSVFDQSTTLSPYLDSSSTITSRLNLNAYSTIIGNNNNSAISYLSQQGINSVGAFFQFIQRNNLFGSEPARTALARFGIKGDDFNSLFARKLYENSQQIDFSAVMSNANTVNGADGSFLGAYGGVGLGSFNFDYNYKCSDYGVIMNLNWIQVDPMQIHGFDPAVLRMKAFDWWTPEYDGKASRAIPQIEVSTSKVPTTTGYNLDDPDIYGFCGIYDEYRHMRDVVLGDFCIGTAQNFIFGRNLGVKRGLARHNLVPQSNYVQYYQGYGDDPTLTNPFLFNAADGDRFYLQIVWEIDSMRPILSSGDSLQLNGEGNLQENTNSSPMS